MRWIALGCSLVGQRNSNDDAFGIHCFKFKKRAFMLATVSDGVGSRKGSGVLAGTATAVITYSIEKFLKGRRTKRELGPLEDVALVESLKGDIGKIKTDPTHSTTFATAALGGRTLTALWSGDSRVYVLRQNGVLQVLTQDDTDPEDALTSYVRGDGVVVGPMHAEHTYIDDAAAIALTTDGIHKACSLDELTDFLLFITTRPSFGYFDLSSETAGFLGRNLTDNATIVAFINPKYKKRVLKAAVRRMERKA